jgi:two-component sensor histidine kinase
MATACGRIVNELVSNAFLHGYSGPDPGLIRVQLTKRGPDDCLLAVEDDGRGFQEHVDSQPESKGLKLVRTFVAVNLKGKIDFQKLRRGTRIEITFPLRIEGADHAHSKGADRRG